MHYTYTLVEGKRVVDEQQRSVWMKYEDLMVNRSLAQIENKTTITSEI